VRKIARRFFLVGGERDDLIQEGMMGLIVAMDDYKRVENGKSFKNFAYLCIRRRLFDAMKKYGSKKNQVLNTSISLTVGDFWELPGPDPEEEMINSDENKELFQLMTKTLSDFEFKIFAMYLDGSTSADICEATGKPSKSVDNAIQRSKKKLQKVLKK
jgi:RNA polymerase sporulation-specific sigma factor